jgi:hypothetical protein
MIKTLGALVVFFSFISGYKLTSAIFLSGVVTTPNMILFIVVVVAFVLGVIISVSR